MQYAIIETGGKQYKVAPGMVLTIERLSAGQDKAVAFDKVLLYVADGTIKIGKPYVSDVVVAVKVISDVKGDKIRVAKFLAKSRYRKVRGHRQILTRVQIEAINSSEKKVQKDESKSALTAKTANRPRTRKVTVKKES